MVMKNIPKIYKKTKKQPFLASSMPGPHPKKGSIALSNLLKDMEISENTREAKKIIKNGEVLVDSKVRKEHRYPVGLFDIVSIPAVNKNYRLVPGKRRYHLVKIPKKESNLKLVKIEKKTIIKGKRIQLNLSDGKNILTKKNYKTKGSLLLTLPDLKIKKEIKRKKGNLGLLVKGKNQGKVGVIKDIEMTKGSGPNMVYIDIGRVINVPEDMVFMVDKEVTVEK